MNEFNINLVGKEENIKKEEILKNFDFNYLPINNLPISYFPFNNPELSNELKIKDIDSISGLRSDDFGSTNKILTLTTNNAFKITKDINVDLLLVGGGGGGAGGGKITNDKDQYLYMGGGGGGGEVIYLKDYKLKKGIYDINIGTGGTGGTGDSKAKTETEKLAEKKADDISGAPKGVTGSTGGTENKEPEKKNEETKLENKIDNKNEKTNETLPVSTGKIETTTQNLSSVSTTGEKPKEPEPNTATTTNTTTSNTSSNTGSSGSTTTEVPKSETTNNEKKVEGNKTEGEGNKEMLDTMKTISALLVQLNSTMQGPLIVTSTNKKFQ